MAHKSQYLIENREKYRGNAGHVICRSTWERGVCKFFDSSKNVKWWSSEEIIVPYICATDGRRHRYFPDFLAEMQSGNTYLIEVKPDGQTRPPKLPKSGRQTKAFKNAQLTYAKNMSKWDAAEKFCQKNGITFAIWTEFSLRKIGIKI